MGKLIVANWKSHKTIEEAQIWWRTFSQRAKLFPATAQVVICPPFPLLPAVHDLIRDSNIALGTQDLSSFPSGAYTGAVSSLNLTELGVTYAIVGHSERRRYFHETHQDVANKVDQALQAGITPIVCVDEQYIAAQSSALSQDQLSRCVVAYEPLEAIGTGDNQPIEQVIPVIESIKATFGSVPIIYGGSVSSANVDAYLEVMDGVLVGSKSLDPDALADIVLLAT